ncbi:putative phage abortive infection protein [Marinifilum fragile]|uniref:putative phage abortive infection protein n=1 Tax=Marinifilum fragile TaxID=570161 RepID=UPI002AAAAFA2|nr:putative phage abortive infection protein [Marinifilum fragile]
MKTKTIIISILTFIVIFLLWFFADNLMTCKFGSFQDSKSFGDIFNALGSLFTALAFAGLIVTIVIQRQDINDQNKVNNIQNFENNFFRLIEQHHRIIDSFVIEPKPNKENDTIEPYPEKRGVITKLEAFDFLAKDFKHRYEKVKEIRFPADKSIQTVFVYAFLHHTYGKYGYMMGHYFRNLYHIVKYIDSDKSLKSFELKYKYAKILRAQLSAPEILLIALNGLTYYGEGFKPFIDKYRLLKNMNFSYEMVDVLWLTGKYPHIIPTVLRENPFRYDGTDFETQAKEVIKNDNYLKEYRERLEKN